MNSDSFLDGRSENAIHLLVQNLRAESKRLGFSRLGIAAVEPPLRQDVFRDWLDQGFAGVMEQWLRRHEKLRADPSTLLKDARSVIVLATDYSTVPPERCQTEQGGYRVTHGVMIITICCADESTHSARGSKRLRPNA